MRSNDTRLHENIKRKKDYLANELYRIRIIFDNFQQLRPTREEYENLVNLYNELYDLFPDLMDNDIYIQEYNLEDVMNDIYDMNRFWGTENLSSNTTNNVELPRQ